MRISIMIAVYKEAELIEDIIQKLLQNNYQDKEVLIAVDGDVTDEIKTALEPYQSKIKIWYNQARLGKVNSLNRLCSHATGDAFLFFDNDIELSEDKNFLNKLNSQLSKFDIVEMPKEAIVKNWFSRIISYDFSGAAISSLMASKLFRKNLFLNGAAFAIRKNTFEELGGFPKVVNEDWELMMNAFEKGKSYAFPIELKVKNSIPTTFDEWTEQRKRWALGAYYWEKRIFKNLKTSVHGLPIILNAILFIMIPVIMGLLFWKIPFMKQIIILLLVLLKENLGINFGPLYLISQLFVCLQGVMAMTTTFAIISSVFFIFSQILKFRFNFFEFMLSYFVYFPILVLFYIFLGLSVIFRQPSFDWKV